jgi:hypothetical protein
VEASSVRPSQRKGSLVALLFAAAFGLVAVSGDVHAQATPPQQKSDGQMESAGGPSKKAVKSSKRSKKSAKKMSQ